MGKLKRKMKLSLATIILLLIGVVLAGCSLFRLPGDSVSSFCTFIQGTVMDSLTYEPLKGVSVRAYHYKSVIYADSTDSMGAYRSRRIKRSFWSSPKELRELRSKPPMREELELRIVFEKPGYRKSELVLPVEFVYCSRHPQPVAIPEVKIPDVFLLRE